MYESPIEIITTGVNLLVEENVYKTVTKLDINVDKDELLMALQYDREQYQKGYKEAIKEFAKRLKERHFSAVSFFDEIRAVVAVETIDELVKEMEEQ